MNLKPPQRESGGNYLRSFWNAACLGGCVGSLYTGLIFATDFQEGNRITAIVTIFAGGTLVSTPLLFLASLLVGPLIITWLDRYHVHRTLIFAFAGGIVGAALPAALILYSLVTGLLSTGNLSTLMTYFELSTIGFCYGAATAAFASLDLSKRPSP